MTALTYDTVPHALVLTLRHWDYAVMHDILHLCYGHQCADPCPIRHHLLLQARCAAVRGAEQEART